MFLTLSEGLFSSLMVAAGAALLTLFMMARLRARQRAAIAKPRLTAQEELERLNQKQALRGDVEDLAVEVEQMARRLGTQLDNKAAALEKLIQDADERIARLQDLQQAAASPSPSAGTPGTPGNPNATSAAPAEGQGPCQSPTVAATLNSPLGSELSGSAQAPAAPPAGRQVSAATPQDPLSLSVYTLADQGVPAPTIARRLGEHVGKVELILALRQAAG